MSDPNENLSKIRTNLLLGINSLLLAASVFLLIFFLIDTGELNITSLMGIILFGTSLALSFTRIKGVSGYISLVGFNAFVLVYGINIKSGYMLTILTTLLLATAFILGIKITIVIFIIDVIGIIVGVIIGNLTLSQPIDPEVGTYYANTITDLIPVLSLGFVIVLIVYRAISNTIITQTEQYELLQKTQSRLINQEKIRSIQTISGGIAHDFNNVLTGILGNISLIADEQNLSSDVKLYLEDAIQAALQGRNLANQLLSFSKKNQTFKIEANVNLVESLQNGAKIGLVGRKSSVKYQIDEVLNNVSGDPNQIEQVIQNLVINADQAMKNGGIIQISANNLSLSPDNPYKLPEGQYVKINIMDEGEGISKEIQNRIFDPFFTTKKDGTGLGLAICKIIIINHMGYIGFDSTPHEGSNFYFILPISQTPESSKIETPLSKENQYKGICLVLDDNPTVLKVISNLLNRFGLDTICTAESSNFLNTLRDLIRRDQPPNLIFLDLTMPGDIGGDKMVKIVREIYSSAYVIVSSGYSDDFVLANYKKYGFDDVLRKPYSKKELGLVLQQYFSQYEH